MRPVQIHPTPITETTFEKQGWTKEEEEGRDGETYHYYILPLPKNSRDPYGPVLISNFSNQKVRGIKDGEYVVEIHDLNGLGFCTTEEEIEVLYKLLTKESIYR